MRYLITAIFSLLVLFGCSPKYQAAENECSALVPPGKIYVAERFRDMTVCETACTAGSAKSCYAVGADQLMTANMEWRRSSGNVSRRRMLVASGKEYTEKGCTIEGKSVTSCPAATQYRTRAQSLQSEWGDL